jgi:pectate lyase
MAQNVIRVPQGCSTVEKAMALAVIFSERKEYTGADPLKIRLDEGVHEIVGDQLFGRMNVTCSHITFVGSGKDQTTIRGGFQVENQQHVKFEELTITNSGLNRIRRPPPVDLPVVASIRQRTFMPMLRMTMAHR